MTESDGGFAGAILANDRAIRALVPSSKEAVLVRAECDIVLLKRIGLEGALRALRLKRAELSERFSESFLNEIAAMREEICSAGEIAKAKDCGVVFARQVTEGGIMAALWETACEQRTGFVVDTEDVEVSQYAVEICEYLRLNPYRLTSAGSVLFVAQDGMRLIRNYRERGVFARIIGRTYPGKAKIIRRGGKETYLGKPLPDELEKLCRDTGRG